MKVSSSEVTKVINHWLTEKELSTLSFISLTNMSDCLQDWLTKNNSKFEFTDTERRWIEKEIMIPIKIAENHIANEFSEEILFSLKSTINGLFSSLEDKYLTASHQLKDDSEFQSKAKFAHEMKQSSLTSDEIINETIDSFIEFQSNTLKKEILFCVSAYYIEKQLSQTNPSQVFSDIKSRIANNLNWYIRHYLEDILVTYLYNKSSLFLSSFNMEAFWGFPAHLAMSSISTHIFRFQDKINDKIQEILESTSTLHIWEDDDHTIALKLHDFIISNGFTEAFLNSIIEKDFILEDYFKNNSVLLSAFTEWLDIFIKQAEISKENSTNKLTDSVKQLAVVYMIIMVFPNDDDITLYSKQ